MSLPEIQADKAQHFFYGALVGTVAAAVARGLGHGADAALIGFAVAALVGATKEACDYFFDSGEPSLADAIWTAAGAVPLVVA